MVGTISGIQGLWVVRRTVRQTLRRLSRFLVPGLVGIPLGIATLAFIDPQVLKLLIAGFLILYGLFFLSRGRLPKFERPTPLLDMVIGFLGGILGGLAGLSGALPAMWCALRPWPRHETRAVLQPYNFAILCLSAITLAARGAMTSQTLLALAIAVPVSVLAAQSGIFVFQRLTDTGFRWVLIGLMFASGLLLLLRTVLL